ncbi:MAG: hypothetical protein IJ774_06185 [Selenomonadaceae bacterium]|nr:hypothetical protein [Selenomonadaceae bacterium]
MKKTLCLVGGIVAALAVVFAFSHEHKSEAAGTGTYQCARCGLIMRVTTPNSRLPERDYYNDGHYHDWRYIGGLSGTIHPIR